MHSQTPPSHRPVRINMDETAIRLLPGARHGLVSVAARHLRQTPRSIARHARQQMRSMSTLIVSVCDDEVLQKKLPQFLILSSNYFRRRSAC